MTAAPFAYPRLGPRAAPRSLLLRLLWVLPALYAGSRFGFHTAVHVAAATVLFAAAHVAAKRTRSEILKAVLLIAQMLMVFAVGFLPSPWGFGSAIPAPLMLRLPLYAFMFCFPAYAASPARPWLAAIASILFAALWASVVLIAQRDPHTVTLADLDRSVFAGWRTLYVALNQPHFFSASLWQNELVVASWVGAVITLQTFRIRGLARRSAAIEARSKALAAYFSPQLVRVLMEAGKDPLPPRPRRLAILNCDLVGFTALAGGMTPQEAGRTLRAFRACVEQAVFAEDGAVSAFVGDGAVALFGLAGEDAAARAVRCAGRLQRAWAEASAGLAGGRAAPVAVGIDLGDALIGVVGEGRSMSLLAAGAPVQGAERLQAATRTSGAAILVSDAVADDLAARASPVRMRRLEAVGAWTVDAATSEPADGRGPDL